MSMNILDKYIEKLSLFSALGYIFFSTVSFGTAAKNIFIGLMLLGLLGLGARKNLRCPPINGISIGVFLLTFFMLLSCIVSSYQLDAFNNFRKDSVPFLLAFAVLTCLPVEKIKQIYYVKIAVWTVVLGFGFKTIFAFCAGVSDGWNFNVYESGYLPKHLDFFVADSIYFMPLVLSVFFFAPMSRAVRSLLFISIVLALYMVFVSGVRTSFILTCAMLLAIIVIKFFKWWRPLLVLFVLMCGFLGFAMKVGVENIGIVDKSIIRYMSILDYAKYSSNPDYTLSGREAIMRGVWQIDREKLALGYGPGWKKLPLVANEIGFMERWKSSNDPVFIRLYEYFSLGYGRVNPHNFYLMAIFEIGIFGLVAYLSILIFGFWYAINFKSIAAKFEMTSTIALAVIFFNITYLISGISAGTWLPPTMLVLAAFLCIQRGNAWNKEA